MKKIISLIMVLSLFAIACLGLVSCGDGSTSSNVTSNDPAVTTGGNFEIPEDPLEGHTPTDLNYFKYKTNEDGTAKITKVYTDIPAEVVVPAYIEENGVKYKVTSIGASAFAQSGVVNVYIPYTITEIGEYAFASCLSLKTISIPTTITKLNASTFSNCTALTALDFIPASVESIGERCFEGCKGLVSNVVVPDSVKTMGDFVFVDCSGMTSIVLSANLESIPNNAFDGCAYLGHETGFNLVIPDTVKSIGAKAFKDCNRLKTIKLSANLETIGANAFNGCKNLAEIAIPDTVKSIGANTFDTCRNLVKVKMSGNAELTIGDNIFGEEISKSCKKLDEIYVAPGSPAETWCKNNGLESMILDVAGYTA